MVERRGTGTTNHVGAGGDGGRTEAAAVASAEAKLPLVEFLHASLDLDTCAKRALDWLAEHVGVEQSLILASDVDPTKLIGIAERGLGGAGSEFVVDLAEPNTSLVRALEASGPKYFPTSRRQPYTPLRDCNFWTIPLRGEDAEEDARAMMVVAWPEFDLPDDITWVAAILGKQVERLRSFQVLAESRFGRERRLLFNVINVVTDPILLTDPEGKLIIANARAEKLFTAPGESSEGRRRAVALNNMLFSSALSSAAIGAHAEADGPGEPRVGRYELLLVDPIEGEDLLFELLSTPVKDPKEGTGVVSILRNITDLGRASEELRESYRKLRQTQQEIQAERHWLELIIDTVVDPIVVTDAAGDVLLMNDPAEKIFQVRSNAGVEEQRRVRANDAHFSSFVSNLLFSGTELRYRGEIGLIEPQEGRVLPVEAVAGKILSEKGELTAVVTILHDRTEEYEKAQLYEELQESYREVEKKVDTATAELARQNELLRQQALELEQASNLKSLFLANMSHEFRTPLNAILGYTHMLLHGVSGEMTAPQQKSLQRVDSNARHLLSIINEILDITRIEAGRMPLHLGEVRLKELVAEVMSELEPIIARSGVKVTSKVHKGTPAILSDRQKLKQIVLNLLGNALKFTPRGSVTVTCSPAPSEKAVRIVVKDTGIGIPAGERDKVFEDFRQVDNSPTRQYGGTGLGLSIVRRLVSMLEGRIVLTSEVGEGSTFTVTVPRRIKRR